MAHGRRETYEDPGDECYSEETYLSSQDVSQHHLSESEHMQGPPPNTARPSSQYLQYAPWHAPPPHPGFQEPSYAHCAVPCANNSIPGNGAWDEPRQHFYPPPPVMGAAYKYTDQRERSADGAIPYQWAQDNGNATSVTSIYAPPLASNSTPNCMASHGPTLAADVHSRASTNVRPYAPGIDAPVPSESLRSLARRLILDSGTHVNMLNVESSGNDRLKVTITLQTADIV